MATLKNFPLKDQRTEKTSDGRPPENGNFDCVPTSLAAAIQYLTGREVNGDELKDAEYGEGYTGGTALRNFFDQPNDRARSIYGVNAEPFNSTSTVALIHQARIWLQQGFPVIATIPSAWGQAFSEKVLASPPFPTHVVVFYTEDGKHMGAMNPWGGFLQAEDDAWWSKRLCYGQIWKIYKEEPVATETKDQTIAKLVAERAALREEIYRIKPQLQTALALIDDLKKHAENPSAVVLTPQQKEDLANMEVLRVTLASMLDGKAE